MTYTIRNLSLAPFWWKCTSFVSRLLTCCFIEDRPLDLYTSSCMEITFGISLRFAPNFIVINKKPRNVLYVFTILLHTYVLPYTVSCVFQICMILVACLCTYTGCPRRNVPDFRRVFLMLKYTDITQNTCTQSWTVTEIMAREKCGLLAVPPTAPVQLTRYVYTAYVRPSSTDSSVTLRLEYHHVWCLEP
jgi:hypothetical protein